MPNILNKTMSLGKLIKSLDIKEIFTRVVMSREKNTFFTEAFLVFVMKNYPIPYP